MSETELATYYVVQFKVLETVKGARSATVLIEMGGATSCDLEEPNFHVGEQYLMSAFEIRYSDPGRNDGPLKRYYNDYCCLRERLAAAVESPRE